jgi:hypothetical protein
MKALSQQGIAAVGSFRQLVPRDASVLYDVRSQTLSSEALVSEAIEK